MKNPTMPPAGKGSSKMPAKGAKVSSKPMMSPSKSNKMSKPNNYKK